MSGETKVKSLWTSALIGVAGMSLSGISEAACRTKLGYEHFGFGSLIKVGLVTGASGLIVHKFGEGVVMKLRKIINGVVDG